jgi:hypothetical protein
MTMRLRLSSIVTVTVALAALTLAPTATADPGAPITSSDAQFISNMAQEGVTAATPTDMIGEGHWICTNLIHGDTASDLDSQIKSKNPQFSQLQVNALIGFAVSAYCEGESGRLGG